MFISKTLSARRVDKHIGGRPIGHIKSVFYHYNRDLVKPRIGRRHFLIAIMVAGLFLSMAVGGSGVFAYEVGVNGRVTALIAHRGYSSSKRPENTLRAFKAAYRKGFDGIEIDVYETESGEILVHHDSSIKRMTRVNKKIWNLTEKQRKKYRIKHKVKIPTLEETFKVCAPYRGPILVHLKIAPGTGYTVKASCLKKIARLARKYKLRKRVIVFGRRQVIGKFAGKYGLKYGITVHVRAYNRMKSQVRWGKKHHISMIMLIRMSALRIRPEDKVKLIHDNGMAVGVYYVKKKRHMAKLNRLGVEYGMSDYKLY